MCAGRHGLPPLIIICRMKGSGSGIEVEVKVRVESVAEGLERLARLEALLEQAPLFEDNEIFDTPDRRLASARCLLRLRMTAGRGILTWKEPVATDLRAKVRAEVECEVGSPEALRTIFEKTGFERVYRYQKYRSYHAWTDPYSGGALAISLDDTPIGVYMELEGPKEAIDRATEIMGFSVSDHILDDYRSLHVAWRKDHGSAPTDMVFTDRDRRDDGGRPSE